MVSDKKNFKKPNLSLAKAVLAVLWQIKAASKETILFNKYVKLLCQDKSKATFRSSVSRLLSGGVLKKEFNEILTLTEKGKKQALGAFIEAELALYRPDERWDNGWRILFFDIPETKRKHRDYLRKIIKKIGFHEFQRSIWIYPHPVPPFLKDLLFQDEIKPHIRFITTSQIDDDSDLRQKFRL